MPDNLSISIGADTSKLRADLAVAQAQLREFSKELRAAAAESVRGGDDSGIQQLAAQYEEAQSRVRDLGTAVRAAHKVIGDKAPFESGLGALKGLREELDRFREGLLGVADNVLPHFREIFALTMAGAVAELGHLTHAAAENVGTLEDIASTAGISTQALEALRQTFAATGGTAEEADAAILRFSKAVGLARREQGDANNLIDSGVKVLRGHADASQQAASGATVLRGAISGLTGPSEGAATVLRGGVQATTDFRNAFNALKIDLSAFPKNEAGLLAALQEYAKRVDAITDPTQRAALASEIFGKSFGRVIPPLKELNKTFAETLDTIAKSGTSIGNATKEQAKAFNASLAIVSGSLSRLRDIVFNDLGVAIKPAFDALNKAIGDNAGTIKQWAKEVGETVAAVIRDFIALGEGGEIKTPFVQGLVAAFRSLRDDIFPSLKAAFFGLLAVFDAAATVINSVFGTNLTGPALLAIAVIGQLTGVFAFLITAVGLAAAAIAALATPIGFITAAVVLIGLTVIQNWAVITKAFTAGGQQIQSDFNAVMQFLSDLATAAFSAIETGVNTLVDWFEGGFQKIADLAGSLWKIIKAGALDAWEFIKKTLGFSLGGQVGDPTTASGFAGGGRVTGSGSGDTVPAWLTPGEFVNRKASVNYYGAGLFRALNSRLIPRDYFSGLGFAMGGLVDDLHSMRPRMKFAEGGMVNGRVAIDLSFLGKRFELSADESVSKSLLRTARSQQLRSTGIKPSFVT